MSTLSPTEEAIADAIYKALVEYDRAKRTARDLRSATRGGPVVKRGTGRSALTMHLTRAVSVALATDERVER